jgi:hypothetical protein
MKIITARLKEIINEEISKKLSESSLEDLEARLAGMGTRRDDDAKKVKHRVARNELNEIARTLQQMFELSNLMVQKKSEHFQNTTVYGLSIREQPALKELADIVREYAKHVKDAETEPMSEGRGSEYSENLRYANGRVDHIIKKVNKLSDEIVHGSTRGGPYQRMPVDMYIDGFDNYDEPRKELRNQAMQLRLAIKYGLDRPVPQYIRQTLKSELETGFLSKMRGLRSEQEKRHLQIILEEVHIRLVEYYIDQEIERMISEGTAPDWDAAKWKATKKKMRDTALGAAAIGTVAGTLAGQLTDYEDQLAADIATSQQQNYEKNSTRDKSAQDLNKLAGNFVSWMWKTNETQTLPFPTNPDNHSEAILPPEWSVVAQVALDKKNGTPAYSVDQNYLKIADSPEALAGAYKDIKSHGAQGAATQFFDRFKPADHPFMDASELGAHSFRSPNPGINSAMLDLDGDGGPDNQNLVYIPFDELPDDYVMPLSGLTKEEVYKKYYYGVGMSLEEFNELKGTVDQDTERLPPELIQKTIDRADSLKLPKDKFTWKESKITWKNYKNRKKVLA